jgi:hypothetical protein
MGSALKDEAQLNTAVNKLLKKAEAKPSIAKLKSEAKGTDV